ncbi:unnamed protein product [Mytilus edulis]|uniref:Uncharacterized protein n=1 Tax=Mytilus edulis TaxID=6550 RepID=A0A8S3R691_MYTED|nr:unnamed protein product [Mytilus edulis]
MKIGDVVVSCILDTGSMVSTISESFFNKMLKSNFELHQDKSWLRLRAANGLDIPYVGYIETDVYLPLFGETIKDRGILILKDSPGVNRKDSSGLIGMNIISQCMDLFKTINNSIKPEHSEIKGFARVAGSSEICVPANSVSIVTVVGPTQTRSKDKIINIEPLSRNTEVMVIDSVSTTERNRYPVRIANLKSSDLWLKPNTRIGVIREVTCLVNQEESEVEFFKTNDNEETIVLKAEINEINSKQDISRDFLKELNCSETEKQKIVDLIEKHQDVFISEELDLGYTTTMQHQIKLSDDKPVAQPYRRIPPTYQRTVESIEYEVEKKHEQPDKDGILQALCNEVSALPRYSNSDMKLIQNSDNTIKQFLIYFNEQRKPSSKLIFTYNSTVHASTGFSPFYLMMGRQPRLPVDSLFDFEEDGNISDNRHEYISEHLSKMKIAYEKAGEHLRKEAVLREKAHNTKASEHKLEVGTRVLIRNRVQGRNKIQDKWNSLQYQVIKCLDADRHVYLIEPIDKSGQPRVENRTNLQVCKFKSQTDSDSSSDEDPIAVGYNGYRQLRRSNRTNFGEHSNVYNEPRSTV